MNKPPLQYVAITEFKGQYSNTDPLDCPEGTVIKQLNLLSLYNGQLTTRGGLKEVPLLILE